VHRPREVCRNNLDALQWRLVASLMLWWKVRKGEPSGGTGIPLQPVGVEPISAKTPQESEMEHLQTASSIVIEVEII